jgi:glycosyltransferase involved in cell wall biosynthesis
MAGKLRIAIDCRIADFEQGVGTALLALAKALSDSNVTDQEYTFLVTEEMKCRLVPYIYGPCRLEGIPESTFSTVKASLRRITPLRFIWKTLIDLRKRLNETAQIPVSDGYVEYRQFDVVHFPTPTAYLTKLPTIYQPQDLQHLHHPQFFTETAFAEREKLYRAFCNQASFVCVGAEWTKQDFLKSYEMAPNKVVVIPFGSVFSAYKAPSQHEIKNTIEKYGLPDQFFIYPAKTWPHKNHEIILRALHILKCEQDIAPHVYFTGSYTDHRLSLDRLAKDLMVSEQVHFLGFVTPAELQAIFNAATAMIYPSRFEGFGLPILEAFQARLPVLSSNAATLPEVGRNGALYFDPDSPSDLSALMVAILNKPELRRDLIAKGTFLLSQYSFKDTAASFRALYAKAAALSAQKHQLHRLQANRESVKIGPDQ